MANTYPTTQFPLGSTEVKVLFNNASNFDDAMNSELPSFYDRFNKRRETWAGMQKMVADFLEAMGFEATHLVYVDGTPLTVLRPTQLIDRAGSVYKVKMPASFPVNLTGTWATDQLLLVDVGDASLRMALAAVGGAGMIGYVNPKTGSLTRTVQSKLDDIYTMEDAGVIGDDVVNDTTAIQRWVENIGRLGGGTARLTAGKTYYVPGTVIIPEFVSIDLNGCTLRGNRGGGSTASMFQTGYFNGSDVLVTNVGGPVDVVMLDGIRVFNGRILEAYRGFEFTNANRNCGIEDITFTGCLQSWLLTRCWSISLRRCFSDTNSDFNVATYKFVDSINAIVCDQVRAVTDFAFEFDALSSGCASIVFLNCDVEGSGNRAFYFQGQFLGVTWIGGYFEAIPGTVFDFADVTRMTARWIGTFNYATGTLLREPSSATAVLDGEWDTSNAIEGITVGLPYPAEFNMQHPRNKIKVRTAGNFDSTTSLPANFITGGSGQADLELLSTRWGSAPGDVLSKAICSKGVIPLRYSGDTGRTFTNQVAFSTHVAFAPGSPTIVILVTTPIVFRLDTMFAKYRFTVTDGAGSYNLFGDIYGDAVKVQDATGKGVAVVNAGGFLRLELSGFTHPSGTYTCKGTVQLCT